MQKKVLVSFIVAAFLLPAIGAHAKSKEGFLGLGAQFMWNNYKQPVLAYSNDSSYIPDKDINAFGTPNLGGHFQWGITNQFVLTVGIDLSYYRHFIYPFHDEKNTNDRTYSDKVGAHIFNIGATIGAKIYFWDPAPDEAVAYLALGIGKHFAVAGSSDKLNRYDLDQDGVISASEEEAYLEAKSRLDNEVEMVSKLSAPFYWQLAVGAEFWASKAFSIGADILGLRFTYASANAGMSEWARSNEAEWSGEQKIIGLYVYSALTLNFNLSARQKATPADDAPNTGWDAGEESGWGDNSGWGNNQPGNPPPPPPPAPAPLPENRGWNPPPAQESDVAPPPPPPPPPPSY